MMAHADPTRSGPDAEGAEREFVRRIQAAMSRRLTSCSTALGQGVSAGHPSCRECRGSGRWSRTSF